MTNIRGQDLDTLALLVMDRSVDWRDILSNHPTTWDQLISMYPALMQEMDSEMLIAEQKKFCNWDNEGKNAYLTCLSKVPRKYLSPALTEFVCNAMNTMAEKGTLELSLLFRMAANYDLAPLRGRMLAAILSGTAGDCNAAELTPTMANIDPELFHAIVERYQDQDINVLLSPIVWKGQSQASRSKIAYKAIAASSSKDFPGPLRQQIFKLLLEIDDDDGRYACILQTVPVESRFSYAAEGWLKGKLTLAKLQFEIENAVKLGIKYMFDGTNIILANTAGLDEPTVRSLVENSMKISNTLCDSLFKQFPNIVIDNLNRFLDPAMLGIMLLSRNEMLISADISRWKVICRMMNCGLMPAEYRIIKIEVQKGIEEGRSIPSVSAKTLCTIIKCNSDTGLQFWRRETPFVQSMVLSAAIQLVGNYMDPVMTGAGLLRSTIDQLGIFCKLAIRECIPRCVAIRQLGSCYTRLGLTEKQYITIALTAPYEGSATVYEYLKLMQLPMYDKSEEDSLLMIILTVERRIMAVDLEFENEDEDDEQEPVKLPWTNMPDWDMFCDTILTIKTPVKVVNVNAGDQPNDIGGPRQQYYGLLGKSISHMFIELDGYLMPRADLDAKSLRNLGKFINRCLYIDHVRPDIPLHPAAIVRMAMPKFSRIYPWHMIEILLDNWFDILSSRAKYTKSLAHLAEDIEERYAPYIASIDALVNDAFNGVPDYAVGVWNISHGLCGRSIELEKIIRLINVQNKVEPRILELAPIIEKVLSSWTHDRIKSLWRFWFGGYHLDDRDRVFISVHAANANDQMNVARAHTCINQIDIPLPEEYLISGAVISTNDNELCRWIGSMLNRALDTQAIFELANLDYQLA
jgi:hypothetical protein